MTSSNLPEVWLRGPVSGIPALLQPVAHALLQAREEVTALMVDFPEELLWKKPAGMASAGFHLQHLTGVTDRLFTYAKAQTLTKDQLAALTSEKQPHTGLHVPELVQQFNQQVEKAIKQLQSTDEQTLTDARGVGRAQISSNVIGLLFHAAEHVQRHVGQLLVTVKVLEKSLKPGL